MGCGGRWHPFLLTANLSDTLFVDSAAGNDANDGSMGNPVQTLAAFYDDIASGNKLIVIADGSEFAEEFPTRNTSTGALRNVGGITIRKQGAGANPVIDGADTVTSWSKTAGSTNVYDASVSLDWTDATSRSMVFEDGVLLKRVASTTACDAEAGTFHIANDGTMSSSPLAVYVHATDSGNPASNGSLYEVTTRQYGVEFAAGMTGCSTYGLTVKRTGGNNGPITLPLASRIEDCRAEYGGKHNSFIRSGAWKDIVAVDCDPPTASEPTNAMLVFFSNDGEHEATVDGVIAWARNLENANRSPAGIIGAFAHANAGRYQHRFTISNYTLRWLNSAIGGDTHHVSLNNVSMRHVAAICGANAADETLDLYDFQWQVIDSAVLREVTQFSPVTTMRNGFIYAADNTNIEIFRLGGGSQDVTFENVTVAVGPYDVSNNNGRPIFANTPSGGSLTVRKCVFFGRPQFTQQLMISDTTTYVGDYNIFCAREMQDLSQGDDFKSRKGSTFYTTLASWQAATGQDANSVYLTQTQAASFWLNDPSTGDWRINPSAEVTAGDGSTYVGTFPDGTPLTDAGAQSQVETAWRNVSVD